MGYQLPLEFKFNNEYTFDSFVTGSNDELVAALKSIASSEYIPFVYFWGRRGIGKTHLLQAFCQSTAFRNKPIAMIPLAAKDSNEQYAPQMLDGLEAMSLVCIDDIHCIAGKSDWENALFHFYNRARDSSTPLVITGDSPPAQLDIGLQDLKTRLAWGLVLQIQSVSDQDKLRALQLRAKHRGMELGDDVGEYMMSRYSRDIVDLMALLNKLDKASLTEQRRLTIPFVKQFLDK